jgi:hypothetical protein
VSDIEIDVVIILCLLLTFSAGTPIRLKQLGRFSIFNYSINVATHHDPRDSSIANNKKSYRFA